MIVIVDNSEQETFFLLLKMSLALWGKSAHTHSHRNAYTPTSLRVYDACMQQFFAVLCICQLVVCRLFVCVCVQLILLADLCA